MSAYNLKRFTRPEILAEINPRLLLELLQPYREFFTSRGLTLPAGGEPPTIDLRALAKVMAIPGADTPPELADALYYIHEMATIEGMERLIDVLTFERLGCGHLELSAADIAVRAWLTDQQVFERTHAEMFATNPRVFEYFQTFPGVRSTFAAPGPERLAPLEAALAESFHGRNRGRGARVFAFPHVDDCLFLVRHGDPYRREGKLEGDEASSVLYRSLRFDVVVYDSRTTTLRVHAQSPWETSLYRGQFGKHLFGDMGYFPDMGRYTLEPLQVQGRASLECPEVPQIRWIALTSAHFHWGGEYDELEVRKARNVFAALRGRNGKLPVRPKVIRATFDVHFRGSKYPRPLMLKPPNVAQYARDEDGVIIDRWLAARGFIPNARSEAHEEPGPVLARA
jgi:hypothetical protein